MAVGAVPLIPLYRVQPTPDARLQRFGVNDSQLFGKPLLNVATPESQPARATRVESRARPNLFEPQDPLEDRPQARVDQRTTAPEPSPTYQAASVSKIALSPSSKPGTHLDVKA